ncbi:ABC transporter ATP-binding protein [Marinobacter goseongensis]|uniref:ABC transporter ATP-binding protein n=1 Tax=Marinobacter goseongensis TaxID=453838 RepID=UPI00200601BA|nr:ABC transporter ATP-binding protein [Marinobacter goseongensis]MCK7551575.1 ABC transporter ATP-binding protein [Marinobacter goseongensis]
MSSDIAISVDGLSKRYEVFSQPKDRLKQMVMPKLKKLIGLEPPQYFREFWAVRDVSFSINKGETVGIIGRNGSGKSTLLQMVCGTVTPTAGLVTTNGRVAALLELGAGFNVEFTGRENVLLNAAILGFPQEEMEQRMGDVLAFSELAEFIDQPVKTYSSGMYARLAFSIAIHVDPDILIIDEALAVGDSRFVAKCMRRIKEIQQRGTTILFVSHDVSSVRTLCDRAIWLSNGNLVEDGDVFPVTGRYMEFMFRDEDGSDLSGANQAAKSELNAGDGIRDDVAVAGAGLDSRPVTHWGSHKGTILSASVCNSESIRKDIHEWGCLLNIVIGVKIPDDIPRQHLGIAFAIKDLQGTDLIVSTTHDLDRLSLPEEAEFEVCFRLTNPLVSGKYLLVAAVENRQHQDIHYYEYFEGAHYFSTLSEARFFGIFQPPIDKSVKVAPCRTT